MDWEGFGTHDFGNTSRAELNHSGSDEIANHAGACAVFACLADTNNISVMAVIVAVTSRGSMRCVRLFSRYQTTFL
uniref:Uncharacterized protein n=1 Tax=Timema poppense TaxID=170557 RepID=A0A7R9DQ88_TIMPO|nr:unnamed protein product [Timema poppensis]